MIHVCCVLKTGGDFDWRYVRILRDSVAKWWPAHVPYKFCILTDKPEEAAPFGDVLSLLGDLPGWWAKMELFSPHVTAAWGNRLYFDLDTAITGPLDGFAEYAGRAFTILRDFYRPSGYGSGVMFIPAGFGASVWAQFEAGGPNTAEPWQQVVRGDQDFLERAAPYAMLWQNVLPNQIVSFKPIPMPGAQLAALPEGARVVCFHGHPRPHELPADHWLLRDYWRPHLRTIDGGKGRPDNRNPTETWDEHMGWSDHVASDGF